MKAMTEIGDVMISTPDHDYLLKPSLVNMTKIGTPEEIIETYSVIAGYSDMQQLNQAPCLDAQLLFLKDSIKRRAELAKHVIACCCDEDVGELVGEYVDGGPLDDGTGRKLVYQAGLMSDSDAIATALTLMTHGVVGQVNIRIPQRVASQSYTQKFKAIDYIITARNHLGMSKDEAQALTMTEFMLLMANKFPQQEGLTAEEYDQAFNDYFERRKKRLAQLGVSSDGNGAR